MLTVELSADDLENNGQFAKIGGVARAIAKAKGVSNLLNSERKIFPRINAGVQSGALNPIDPETLEPLSKSDYGHGLVNFDELAEWGRSRNQFDFRIPASVMQNQPEIPRRFPAPAPQNVGAGATAKAKGGRKQGPARELLIRILDELEKWAAVAGEPFDRRRMPGQVGKGPDDAPGFHWFCAEIDGHVFRRAKATFEKHRDGLCTFAGWAKASDFYRRALPHIAPKFASGNKAAKLPVGKRKAA